jgi:putative photosynthetic complex assembly protein
MLEHDAEVAPGLPEELPRGESLLWQGAPGFSSVLRGSFHFVKLVTYFAALLVVQFVLKLGEQTPVSEAIASTFGFALLAAAALGLLALYVRLVTRSTLFTLTDQRIVLRTGVAVPVTINLPYSRIEAADLRLHKDGSGDIVLVPEAGSRVSWLLLWPMVKPFRWWRVRPVLRGIENAESVASMLADALGNALAAAPTARRKERDLEPAKPDAGPKWRPYPGVPLAAMVALVVISLVGAGVTVLNNGTQTNSVESDLVASVDLLFEDQADGSVTVRDAASGQVIEELEPGTNGFVRATLRTLAGARESYGAGPEAPFRVGRTALGRIFLIDPVSGREIDLRAFGPTNSEAFARYLDGTLPTAGAAGERKDSNDASDTALALQREEYTP